ncbi:DUF2771 domain-containing protein [Corynebacterium sp. Q4381]|uniref:DUF2771 domain-containing protein n=1 Tax=Corynebacterium sp. Marseille-Q4381 TaxID=3121597 RepID=UPI002FE5440C
MARPAGAKSVKPVIAIVIAALLLVAGLYAFLEWQNSRPGTPVRELRVEVTSAGKTLEVEPYTVCELDEECPGGQPPSMELDEAAVHVSVPAEIANSSWRMLAIYDDPAANNETVYTSGEASEHDVEAVTESGARLVVAEVSALAIDHDASGEEIPVIATWSVGF